MANNGTKITAPVSITDVKTTLGVSYNDLGALCKAAAINKWSFWKPVVKAQVTGMTNADYYSVNDGFTINSYNRPSLLIKAIINDTAWQYTKPYGTSASPYRLGDFRNYNKNFPAWFSFTTTNNSIEIGKSAHFSIINDAATIAFGTDMSLRWLLSNFSLFNFCKTNGAIAANKACIGLLFTKTWANTITSAVWLNYADIVDALQLEDDGKMNITIPSSGGTLTTGTWYVIPCVTNYQNSTSSCVIGNAVNVTEANGTTAAVTYYPLPVSPVQINISASGSTVTGKVTVTGNYSAPTISGQRVTLSSSTNFVIRNTNTSAQTIQYYVTANGTSPATTLISTTSVSVAANGSSTISLSGKYWNVISGLDPHEINITVTLWWRIGSGNYNSEQMVVREKD